MNSFTDKLKNTKTKNVLSDSELIEKIKQNDQKAFQVLFERYYERLCRFANTYSHDVDGAEEIIQGVFINIWNKRGSIKIHSSVKSYLYAAGKNHSLNYLRSRSRLTELNVKTELLQTVPAQAELQMEYSDLKKMIQTAVQKLPKRCREIFVLRKEEELSYKEIAERLQISRKTVENQLSIALKRIKEHINPYMEKIFVLTAFIFIKFY